MTFGPKAAIRANETNPAEETVRVFFPGKTESHADLPANTRCTTQLHLPTGHAPLLWEDGDHVVLRQDIADRGEGLSLRWWTVRGAKDTGGWPVTVETSERDAQGRVLWRNARVETWEQEARRRRAELAQLKAEVEALAAGQRKLKADVEEALASIQRASSSFELSSAQAEEAAPAAAELIRVFYLDVDGEPLPFGAHDDVAPGTRCTTWLKLPTGSAPLLREERGRVFLLHQCGDSAQEVASFWWTVGQQAWQFSGSAEFHWAVLAKQAPPIDRWWAVLMETTERDADGRVLWRPVRVEGIEERARRLSRCRFASPIDCEHANEAPKLCPCPDGCYCRQAGNTCAFRSERD